MGQRTTTSSGRTAKKNGKKDGQKTKRATPSALELARKYYAAWSEGAPLEPAIFAEDLRFEGSLASFDGRNAFLAALSQMPPMTLEKEHLQIADGDDVVTYFDCGMGGATISMAEWIHAEGGQIRSIKLVYDSAAFPKPPS